MESWFSFHVWNLRWAGNRILLLTNNHLDTVKKRRRCWLSRHGARAPVIPHTDPPPQRADSFLERVCFFKLFSSSGQIIGLPAAFTCVCSGNRNVWEEQPLLCGGAVEAEGVGSTLWAHSRGSCRLRYSGVSGSRNTAAFFGGSAVSFQSARKRCCGDSTSRTV